MAIARRRPHKGCVHHSDRGSQYCSHDYQKILRKHGFKVLLPFMYYNFVRLHQTLKFTPAMEAGLTDRLWDIKGIVANIDANEEAPKKRGPYKKRISK